MAVLETTKARVARATTFAVAKADLPLGRILDGESKFKIKELGSKYLFTLIYCFIEKNLLNIKK